MSAIFLAIKKLFYKRGPSTQTGVSLVEMILYVVLLVIVMSVIVQSLVAVGRVYRSIMLTRELESSGTIAMEQMLREIRNASSLVLGESVIGTSPGAIAVSGVDESLNPYETKFDLVSGVLQISKNSETPASITSSPVSVSYLLFTRVATSTSEGVRIELEVSGTAGSISKSERFYGFTVLRGSY